MADGRNLLEIIIRAKDLTANAVSRFRRRWRAMGTTIKSVTSSVVAFTAAAAGVVFGLQRLGQRGDAVIAVKRAFARTTDDETAALERLEEATGRAISKNKLMALSNQAIALGAARSVEDFANQAEAVRRVSRSFDLSAEEGLDKWTTGMARLSKLRLDDLGLTIEQEVANQRLARQLGRSVATLTEAEKATAFRNEATRQLIQLSENLAGKENVGAGAAARFAAGMKDARDRIAELVAESPAVAAFFDSLTSFVEDWIDILTSDGPIIEEAFKSLGRIAANAFSGTFLELVSAPGRGVSSILRGIEDRVGRLMGLSQSDINARRAAAAGVVDAPEGLSTEAFGNISAELEVLRSLGRQARSFSEARRGERAAAASGSVRGTPEFELDQRRLAGLLPPGTRFDHATGQAFGLTHRPGFVPARGIEVPDVEALGLNDEQERMQELLTGSSAEISNAGEIAAASISGAAAAIISGSGQIEASLISMVTNILRSLPGVGGLAGALIGGAGSILGAIVGRDDKAVPVRMTDIDDSAAAKLRENSREPIHITSVTEIGGLEVGRLERILHDREQRNATQRF